jgi:hypothetical protein
MTDIFLPGNYLRNANGLTLADSSGVAWSFDPATHKVTLAITAGAVGSFDEAAQDAVGGILTDSSSINFTYDDAGGTITAAVIESWAPTWTALHTFSAGAITGDPGTEGSGINVGGVTYDSVLKVSDISGSNPAQLILHRHSTTLAPVFVSSRSHSSGSSHGTVLANDILFALYGVGWASTRYEIAGGIAIAVDGAVGGDGDMPGRISFYTTPNGSGTTVERLRIDSTGLTTFFGVTQHTTLEIGHASDTTLSRASAGVLAVEGVSLAFQTISLTAGAGLTGGGDLSANRTFAVGAGTGITVNADDVAVNQAFAPTWTGPHVFSAASGVPATINAPANTTALTINPGTAGYPMIENIGTTGAQRLFHLGNSGSDAYVGTAGSAGGALITDSAAYSLELRNDTGFWFGIGSSAALAINSSRALRLHAYGAGTLQTDASGNVTAVSDERTKCRIRPYTRGLADICALRPILHGYKAETGLDQSKSDYASFSAQNVRDVMPEAVGVMPGSGLLTVSDRAILAALVNAVQELAQLG